MSRRSTRFSANAVEQRALDLLEGRTVISADALLEVIHAINPTGRSLAAVHERRRYHLKARLQSLLVRTFLVDLVVSEEAQRVVAIRHRYLGRDGCHAQLDELDDDARAHLQLLLDTGDGHETTAARRRAVPVAAPLVVEPRLIEQGRTALAAFDYDTARSCFERAVAASPRDPAAAAALLELLVDHLALDADALALEVQLAAHVARDPEVRGLLAVAAARLGEHGTAHRWLDGLVTQRAADAWVDLAHQAVERGMIDELERGIAQLVEIDPARPELIELRAAVDRLRADARRPAEDELARACSELDDTALEAMAHALLVRWPDSAVAGKVLGGIHDRRRTREVELVIVRARTAFEAGELAHAAELCRQARALGADPGGLIDEIRRAEAEQQQRREDADANAVCARLQQVDRRVGLMAYLALAPGPRKRVRSAVALPMLDWLESAGRHHKESRHGALVEAVLALAAANDAVARGDDEDAIALVELHAAALADVAAANELVAEARRRIAARRREVASAGIELAMRALAAGDLEACSAACGPIDRRELDRQRREQLDDIVARLGAHREAAGRRERIAQLIAAGDLVGALRELEALLAVPSLSGEHGPSLCVERDALRARVRRAWTLRSDAASEQSDGCDRLGELLGRLPYSSWTLPWLVAGGRELLVATAAGAHVFVGRVRVDDGRMLARHYLRAPAPLDGAVEQIVDGDTLWLIDRRGAVLQIAWRTGEPLRSMSLERFLGSGELIEHAFMIPGGSHLWFEAMAPRGEPVTRVIEIDGWRLRRELPRSRNLQPLIAGPASRIIGASREGGAVLYGDRGTVLGEIAACADVHVTAVAQAPDGDFIVLGHRSDEVDELEIARVHDGRIVHRRAIPESSYERSHRCATATAAGLVIVHHVIEVDDARLAALRVEDLDLPPTYTVTAPSDLVLVQDVDATDVVGVWDTRGGVRLARVAERPAFDDGAGLRSRWSLPAFAHHFSCGPYQADDADGGRLYAANEAARKAAWDEVRAQLEDVALDSVDPQQLAHHCHLLGLAWLRTGVDPARIRALWTTGHAHEPSDAPPFRQCRLDEHLELLDAPPAAAIESSGATTSLTGTLRRSIAGADELLAAGDARSALRKLRCRAVSSANELQSMARVAAAWLAVDAPHASECFDKAIALSRFVALHADRAGELPFEGAYRPERMSELVAQAERWLMTWHDHEDA